MLKKGYWLFFLLVFSISNGWAADFAEGIEYERLNTPVRTSNPDKVVVTELFWYGCPHCFRLEPYIEKWKKSEVSIQSIIEAISIWKG